uniref:Uncharacterized protein n=1 Tax=Cucumis melo TaxID=3656 RepID=A0A9I9DC18_CUCME
MDHGTYLKAFLIELKDKVVVEMELEPNLEKCSSKIGNKERYLRILEQSWARVWSRLSGIKNAVKIFQCKKWGRKMGGEGV